MKERKTVECRKACAGRPRFRARTGSTARIDVTYAPPRATGIFLICFSVFIAVFCVFAVIISEPGGRLGPPPAEPGLKENKPHASAAEPDEAHVMTAEDRQAAILGSAIFGPIAIGLAVYGASRLYRRDHIRIIGERITFERRAFVGSRSFSESVASYVCVLPAVRAWSVRSSGGIQLWFYATIVHRSEDSLNVVLRIKVLNEQEMATDPGSERKLFEDLARTLDLPLATVPSKGSPSIRYPDELDLSLADIAASRPGAVEGIGADPERPFPTRRYRITATGRGFTAERGYPVYLIPFLLLAGAVALLWSTGAADRTGFGFPLVLGLFALFMLAFSLTRARLVLGIGAAESAGAVEAVYTVAGIVIMRRSIPVGEIEEVDIVSDPRHGKRVLRIASDRTTIMWSQTDRPEETEWFRDRILWNVSGRGERTERQS